ncbi:kunitz-type serine protease inhibitor A-like [Spodoptera frugiperda]|uniref:Kunitz-type serine protease inhibitor A-like n=1 Tax=Spodoptera frugiperda TaxID=7108 RepID=A0A9R0D399_SPOFR|nr:kunitz-type serine protease inhibitor A-like [Spodoptera frugiperda]
MVFPGKGISPFRVYLVLLIFLIFNSICDTTKKKKERTTLGPNQKRICLNSDSDNSIRAKRKVCLLRPDNGPCRADVISWYYDARKRKCYRFFYGGCQGNGNNFVSEEICKETCYLSTRMRATHQPYFCQLTFDYGTCFGQYNRWHWDHISGHCRRRLYSGCGGNQNNFETKQECMANCLTTPNNTLNVESLRFTTCIPFTLAEFS